MSLTELGRDDSQGFEICLRRRLSDAGDEIDELVVNGAFAMDSLDHSSEDALAGMVPTTAHRVMVAGLGLGFTAYEVLTVRPRALIDVIELSSALIGWARQGATETLSRVAGDPRVRFYSGDVTAVLGGQAPAAIGHSDDLPAAWDAILLDVDNGPDFLIHPSNASLYDCDLLAAATARLTPGGVLAIWCQQHSTALQQRLDELTAGHSATTASTIVSIERDGHQIDYAIHSLTVAD